MACVLLGKGRSLVRGGRGNLWPRARPASSHRRAAELPRSARYLWRRARCPDASRAVSIRDRPADLLLHSARGRALRAPRAIIDAFDLPLQGLRLVLVAAHARSLRARCGVELPPSAAGMPAHQGTLLLLPREGRSARGRRGGKARMTHVGLEVVITEGSYLIRRAMPHPARRSVGESAREPSRIDSRRRRTHRALRAAAEWAFRPSRWAGYGGEASA